MDMTIDLGIADFSGPAPEKKKTSNEPKKKRKKKRLPHYLIQRDMDFLLSQIEQPVHRIAFYLMGYGGLRVSEACNLKLRDLNISKGYIQVIGKGDKERQVPISATLHKELSNYLKDRRLERHDDLIQNDRTSLHRQIKKYGKMILNDEEISCHTLRHSYATMLYNNGTPLDKLRIILGHESTTTTEIYAHMGLDDIQKEVAHSEKGFLRKLGHKIRMKQYNQFKMSFRETQVLRGRDEDMKIVDYYLREGLSFILHGQPGIGKTFFAQHIQNIIYIEQFNRKTTLIELLLKHQGHDVSEHRELIRKEYSRLRIDEIFHEVENMGGFNHPVVIDNIEQHTKGEKKMITRLGKCTQVIGISASSRMEITRMFDTEHELLAVNKDTRRQIIYEMCHVPDLRQKDRILDKIMDKSGDNLKEAKYVITQMNLGRRPEDIVTSSEASNEVSIAPFIILGFMVLVLLVIKTVAVSIFTTVIIVSWLARFAFTRFLFNPALRASKNGGGR